MLLYYLESLFVVLVLPSPWFTFAVIQQQQQHVQQQQHPPGATSTFSFPNVVDN